MPAGRRHNACMQRITAHQPHALHDTAATRRIEAAAAAALPEHTLMQRAGRATARLALALAPHARRIWIACGGGNNGGDGLEAAMLLHRAGHPVVVTWLGTPATLPADARQSWQRALDAGAPAADMRQRQMEAIQRVADSGDVPGGVMLVPMLGGLDDWESAVLKQQHHLKLTVKE